ncbi:unnamed protein product [Moneuplotes crassus]|uniref:Uncharacterized protein n=1 Tax=Euplotes crassus TaxID=5936 RepID=A0AAD1U5A1_EUPCR|nr:unnamed protein product [Moneuplotes crassus]
MSKFPECYADTCHQTASVYVEKERSYFCGDCFDLDFAENGGESLVPPNDAAKMLELVENVLKMYRDFAADKYEDEANETTEKLCNELMCEVEGLKDKLTEALNDGHFYEFPTLKTKATNIQTTLANKKTFVCFALKKLWRSAQDEIMNSKRSPMTTGQSFGEDEKFQEVFKNNELAIEKVVEENKKLCQEDEQFKAKTPSQICPKCLISFPVEPSEEAKFNLPSKPKLPKNPLLQEEMGRDPECLKFVDNMKEDKGAWFLLKNELHQKVFRLVDQAALSELKIITIRDANLVDEADFTTFTTKIPLNLNYFDFNLESPYSKITAYLPSILLLSSKITGTIRLASCTITVKEIVLINKTFKAIRVRYGKLRVGCLGSKMRD